MKYYAVRNGRTPGIYTNWSECERQTKGFAGAVFKSFLSRQEAEVYCANIPPKPVVAASPDVTENGVIAVWTDGACRGNPGKGGFGVLLRSSDRTQSWSGAYRYTTNNRMELLAVLFALRQTPAGSRVHVVTDSTYVCENYQQTHLTTNGDLWQQLRTELLARHVTWAWTRGHSGHLENEACDVLASQAAAHGPYLIDTLYERIHPMP